MIHPYDRCDLDEGPRDSLATVAKLVVIFVAIPVVLAILGP